jgi:hypothetical protein
MVAKTGLIPLRQESQDQWKFDQHGTQILFAGVLQPFLMRIFLRKPKRSWLDESGQLFINIHAKPHTFILFLPFANI